LTRIARLPPVAEVDEDPPQGRIGALFPALGKDARILQ
jgi:hypothetical protein